MPDLFCLRNYKDTAVFKADPTTFTPNIPPEVGAGGKAAMTDWLKAASTNHLLYSGVEAVDPTQRVATKNSNPPLAVHAAVVDFDLCDGLTDEEFKKFISGLASEKIPYPPNFVGLTQSRGLRLLFVYEAPVVVGGPELFRNFRKAELKELKLNKLAPGLDETAFLNPSQYYEVGHSWQEIHDTPIPTNVVHQLAFEASQKTRLPKEDFEIPLEDVAAEVAKQFPGSWAAENFFLGARGVRFWDPGADCPTGACVAEGGMQCFTGDESFVPWDKLLGEKFVSKYRADHTGQIANDVFYDGRTFWIRYEDGKYHDMSTDAFRDDLIYRGVSNKQTKDGQSPVRSVLAYIRREKRVKAAFPFVHFPQGIILHQNERFLNIATARPMRPVQVDEPLVWGDHFPWLREYFEGLFDAPSQIQLERFLAWFKRFYASALDQKPVLGQINFIAGPTGTGKTFLVSVVLNRAMGGYYDASDYAKGNDNYPGEAQFNSPVWAIDDATSAASRESHTRYSAMIKKLAANRDLKVNEKYAKAGMTMWNGRVCINANVDQESLRILPNTEISMLDKINLFRCGDRDKSFFSKDPGADLRKVEQELPYFLRWLLEWDPPDHCKVSVDSRYGVASYHHPTLTAAARSNAESHLFLEILMSYLSDMAELEAPEWEKSQLLPEAQEICLSAHDLYQAMCERSEAMKRDFSLAKTRRMLSQLQSLGYNIEPEETDDNRTVWHIPYIIRSPEYLEKQARLRAAKLPTEEDEVGTEATANE